MSVNQEKKSNKKTDLEKLEEALKKLESISMISQNVSRQNALDQLNREQFRRIKEMNEEASRRKSELEDMMGDKKEKDSSNKKRKK